jgi:excisionase family DNA binding protein
MHLPDEADMTLAQDRLLTNKEAAELLGICVDTLLAHVRDGQIKAIIVGHGTKSLHRRYERTDLEAFKVARTQRKFLSTNAKASRTIGTISSSQEPGFLARQNARINGTRKHSNSRSAKN